MKYIDLSYTLDSFTPVSPYDNSPELKRVKFIKNDYYNDSRWSSTMHIGTHIDAPSHMLDINKNISDYPIDKFIGKGVLLNFEGESIISLREEDKTKIKQDSIVVVYTNMDKKINTIDYFDKSPQISEELCDYLISKQINILALDFYSPDSFPFTIHKKLLAHDILIVENLKNVDQLVNIRDFVLHLIPIKLNAEGAFVRAYAEVL